MDILEKVKMVLFDVKDNPDSRIKAQKTVCVFACFGDKCFRPADPDIAADRFQDAADGNRRIHIVFQKDLGDHVGEEGIEIVVEKNERYVL